MKTMKKTLVVMAMVVALAMSSLATAMASTVVPGHQDRDGTVVGTYSSSLWYDADWDYV